MNKKIKQMAEAVKQDLFAFTRQLIAIQSFSGKEEGVIQCMKTEMEKSGYERVWVDDFGNLLGIIGTGERLIALDGHCDTVGIGNPESWQWDPFFGNHQDGIIYGRGMGSSCDSFFIIIVWRIHCRRHRERLQYSNSYRAY